MNTDSDSLHRRSRFAALTLTLFLFSLLFVAPLAFSQEGAETATATENVSALDLYKQGGAFMHILLVCSIGTIAVAVY
jgi:hypothetical protein